MAAKLDTRLYINLLTSDEFYFSPPLIIAEARKRDYHIQVYKDKNLPPMTKLLDCNVYIDFSALTDIHFYEILDKECQQKLKTGKKVPLMVDPPRAVINSMDKRKTHEIFPDLVPESYDLDGLNNEKLISKFMNDKYIIIKDPFGWQSKGVERISPVKAINKYKNSKDLIVQKYIPSKSVGRILTLNHNSDFEIICAYLRTPTSWKTEENGYKCELIRVDKDILCFAKEVSERCGLYLNGIDYIYNDRKYNLLEVNAAPGIKEPYDEFGIDTAKMLFDHIDRNI